MPRCVVRPYADRDFDDYADTLLRTMPCANHEEAGKSAEDAVKRSTTGEELWVAELDGRAVGFILLDFTRVWGHKGESFKEEGVCIDWLDVNPDFQRKGIGEELIRKAEARASQKRLDLLFAHTTVDNNAMMGFASKNGFKVTKRIGEFWGEGTKDAFLLEKALG